MLYIFFFRNYRYNMYEAVVIVVTQWCYCSCIQTDEKPHGEQLQFNIQTCKLLISFILKVTITIVIMLYEHQLHLQYARALCALLWLQTISTSVLYPKFSNCYSEERIWNPQEREEGYVLRSTSFGNKLLLSTSFWVCS